MSTLPRKIWLPCWIAYFALLLFFALGPEQAQPGMEHGDKFAHFGAFLLLIFGAPWTMSRWGIVAALALTVVVGGTIELAQDYFTTWNRTGDLFDFLADLAGGVFGLGMRLSFLRNVTA